MMLFLPLPTELSAYNGKIVYIRTLHIQVVKIVMNIQLSHVQILNNLSRCKNLILKDGCAVHMALARQMDLEL